MAAPESSRSSSEAKPDLAIICAHGLMPHEIAQAALDAGRRPFLVGIEGEAEETIAAMPVHMLAWGQFGRLILMLKERGIGEVVFAGAVRKRPDFLKMKLDWGTIRALPKILGFMIGGDNTVLSGTIKLFAGHGIDVLGAHQVAPHLLAGAGAIAGRKPARADMRNIREAFAACKALGHLDIGQAAIAEGGRVVAVEGAEGTSEMLLRIVRNREIGRMPREGKNGVIVKTMKPEQDVRADLPAIGPDTVDLAVRAGLRGIALEADKSIILGRAQTVARAREAGLYIYGVRGEELEGNG
ncbi:MAG: UDP-2,3-diacylglucosamine diphosphatase LpxI [Rhizobiaceae bacterium]